MEGGCSSSPRSLAYKKPAISCLQTDSSSESCLQIVDWISNFAHFLSLAASFSVSISLLLQRLAFFFLIAKEKLLEFYCRACEWTGLIRFLWPYNWDWDKGSWACFQLPGVSITWRVAKSLTQHGFFVLAPVKLLHYFELDTIWTSSNEGTSAVLGPWRQSRKQGQ